MNRLVQMTRKDFVDAARDRELYVAGALFLLIGLGIGYLVGNSRGAPSNTVARLSLTALVFFGSVAAISLSYNQIVGKRASGELRVLLSLPFSRFETVYGTALGRWLLMTAMATTTVFVAAIVAAVMGGPVAIEPLVGTLVAVWALLAVFVSLSAGSANTTRAAGGAFGLFILFLFRLWDGAPLGIRYVLNGFSLPGPNQPTPTWAKVWGQIAPIAGLRNALAGPFPNLAEMLGSWAPQLPTTKPVYAEPWFGAVVVLVWIVLPVTLGYVQLRNADL
ncbi:MAG: ABC transporter permease subunit [Halapricum sp.]